MASSTATFDSNLAEFRQKVNYSVEKDKHLPINFAWYLCCSSCIIMINLFESYKFLRISYLKINKSANRKIR